MRKNYILYIFLFLVVSVEITSCSSADDYVILEDVLPKATDDAIASTLDSAVEIQVLANDTTGDMVVASTVSLVGGTDSDLNGTLDLLTVPNEGNWQVNPETGSITFTPLPTFSGNPLPISYTVSDAQNNQSNPATVIINAVPMATLDLTQVPYPKLSDYKFFIGALKNLTPSINVIPFEPASSLFSDYANKKRFVWMPIGSKATFTANDKTLELPIGAALIKTFYYDNVQPSNTRRIIETRIMIRKASGWIFTDYVWNANQTEAYFDVSGSFTAISWKDENNVIKSTNYRIPNEEQCIICHKSRQLVNGVEQSTFIPIGIKPQNLNFDFDYNGVTKNQLTKWIEQGYLENNFALPPANTATVDYSDASKPLALRARSYVDINCAHCHENDRYCGYRPMRFAFTETGSASGSSNLGVCVNTQDMQGFPAELDKIVSPGNARNSMLLFRINTTNETFRMPLHGRTMIHEEGVTLIQDWINSLQSCD